jgi:hypothetical protein
VGRQWVGRPICYPFVCVPRWHPSARRVNIYIKLCTVSLVPGLKITSSKCIPPLFFLLLTPLILTLAGSVALHKAPSRSPYSARFYTVYGFILDPSFVHNTWLDPPSLWLCSRAIQRCAHNHGHLSTLRGGGDPSVMWPWHRPPPWRSPQRTSQPAAARGAAPRGLGLGQA